MEIIIDKGKVIIKGITEKPIVIPSQLYPLNGSLEIFCSESTEDCEDKQLREIFDSVRASVGFCYSNTENLIDALKAAGISKERYRTYAGWLFIGDTLPVHHAYTVVDDKYMLDFSTDKIFEDVEHFQGLSSEKVKDMLAIEFLERRHLPHSKRATFGKVGSLYLYIGSICKPQHGKKIYQKLVKAYPKHPCIRNVTPTGATDTQNRIAMKVMEESLRE